VTRFHNIVGARQLAAAHAQSFVVNDAQILFHLRHIGQETHRIGYCGTEPASNEILRPCEIGKTRPGREPVTVLQAVCQV
jgi:hypothetical protein